MKKIKNIILSLIVLLFITISTCNRIVCNESSEKCYNNIDSIPRTGYGILLGTGRSKETSPYYDARIQATKDLIKAHKINVLIISGENLYEDYCEVDSMKKNIQEFAPTLPIYCDYNGKNTYLSLLHSDSIAGMYFDEWGFQHGIIITQRFHAIRAVYIGNRKVHPIIYPKHFKGTIIKASEQYYAYEAKDTNVHIWRLRNAIREIGARVKAVLL